MNNLEKFIDMFKSILEPVTVDYSNTLLAEQIHGIAILAFIMCVLIMFLLSSLLFSMFIFAYSEKLLNYFTNKYIRWYITLNRKLIGLEIFFLGGSILFFMYTLSYGLHFIATHPIIPS